MKGHKIHLWTAVDIPGMKAEDWEAAAAHVPEIPYPQIIQPTNGLDDLNSQTTNVYIAADTANQVDDPFAIYRALLAPKFHVVGQSSTGWGAPSTFAANVQTSQK